MPEDNPNKRTYTLVLSIAFIGIGAWKLYERFYQEGEVETYQWILAAGLLALGIYQLIGLRKK
ncbi:hypothetical protein LX97_02237 [Nonlabens dokdonensis]|jgi:hypothetical protein|uniref:Uncharacterized protein n=2 Tax=Nonlabens dokdonensis TaxID=328515 RepID=L7WBS8_NONDD|nr:hypothetical protein [Nonlabens dokdonensis]AGC77569.1 hypothetical protein DDD_2442 [Nonlabens dokdonensis DSW-6]PZX39879.1 hypothetical protein LX97_02237 [Nonlabens dokdonensis]